MEQLCCSYGKHLVLDNVSFSIPKKGILGLLGPNGAGKTTLLKSLGGLIKSKSGKVMLDGIDLSGLSLKERSRQVGYVPQSANSLMSIRVIDIVMMGRIPYLRFNPSESDRNIVFKIVEHLGLEGLAFRYFNQLSGGERQRVLIARAIAQQPSLLLLDEPTSSLDMKHQLQTVNIVREYAKKEGITVVVSLHDLNLASMFCDQIMLFKDKGCYAYGSCEEVLTSENIQDVYEVQVETEYRYERTHVILLNELEGEIK